MPAEAQPEVAARLVAAAAAAAAAEAYEQIVHLSAHQGRGGVVVHLRQRAAASARTPGATDQLRSCALHAAAEDVAWGRSPLCEFPSLFALENGPTEEARAQVRPPEDPESGHTRAAAEAWARGLEDRALRDVGDACDAAMRLPDRLADELRLQAALWDDPRIPASPQTRREMRAVQDVLTRRLQHLQAGAQAAADGGGEPERSWRGAPRWVSALWRWMPARLGCRR